jgi:bifunctional non-homologous end joining protein LigD
VRSLGGEEDAMPQVSESKRVGKASTLPAVRLTHPDRVLFPEQGITKASLARYYAEVADRMLPHVAGRPLMLVRCPEGEGQGCFHQKHPARGISRDVRRVPIVENSGATAEHMMVEDARGLVSLVQMGALEIHTWGSKAERSRGAVPTTNQLEYPDQLTFDLDPDEGLPWVRLVEAALTLRKQLEMLGLSTFLKTTGGKGVHIVTPIEPSTPWDDAKLFCRAVAELLVQREPDKYVANIAKAKRKGKVLIDYLRNGRGATAVAPYSTRAKPGAPVATPLRWEELTAELRPGSFTVETIPARLRAQRRDPWKDFGKLRPALPQPRGQS